MHDYPSLKQAFANKKSGEIKETNHITETFHVISSGEDLNVNQVSSSKKHKQKLFGHFSTVWDVETMKCLISLESGRALDLSKQESEPNWDDLIMVDLLILGSEDGFIRVFTKPKEFATSEMLALNTAFEQEVYNKVSCMKNPDVLQEQLKSFTDIAKMPQVSGRKEGEIRIFRDGNSGKAYSWQKGKWNYVGEMMAGPEDSANNSGAEIFGGKKYYKGDRFFSEGNYDFIFDIEDEQGIQRKLPFNLGDNTLIAAEQFLARERWPVTYKEQVITFLNKNTRPRTNKPVSQKPSNQSQYQNLTPVARAKGLREEMKSFPVYNVESFYRKMNAEGMLKMIKEHNSTLIDEDFKIKMTDYEVEVLSGMLNELGQPQPTRDIEDREFSILQKKLMTYKGKISLPIVDLIRILVLHHSSIALLDCLDSGNKFLMFAMRNYSLAKGDPKLANKFLLTILKILCNMFKCNPITFINCQMVIETFYSEVLNSISRSGLKIILCTLHNLSMYLVLNDKKDFKAAWIFNLMEALSEIFEGNFIIILLQTLGNFIYLNDLNIHMIKSKSVFIDAILKAKEQNLANPQNLEDICKALNI